MRNSILAFALSLAAALPFAARADDLSISTNDAASVPATALPRKGEAKNAVLNTFGQPQLKHPAAGGDSPKHPPITRWDYASFSVFFEHDHVVDAVVPGHPAQVFHTDHLKPVTASY